MSKETILSVENFSVYYEPTIYRPRTVRDLFVGLFKSPMKFVMPGKDRLQLMNDLNLTVKKGDIVALLGANGAGKTTLCRYFSGIIKSKNVIIKGEVRAIFDTNISFYPNLTGRENTVMLTEVLYSHCSSAEKKRLIEEALHFSELNEFIDVPINNYSKGMRARLYLSLVTAKEADLLVLDEIFGGTDIFFSEKLEQRIKRLIEKSGAVILVSHDFNEISKYANRAVVLADKKIVYDGPPEEAIHFYSDRAHVL